MSVTVDAAWLTWSLQASLRTSASVTAFTATTIGTGQVGENVRFELTWDADDATLPTSVVGKFPSVSEISRATAAQMNTYVKEVGFYRELQHDVTICTPRIHAVEWDADTHDFAIVMEDVHPATQGDQLVGCTVGFAETAVDQVVGLHAPTWGRDAELTRYDWLTGKEGDESAELRITLFQMLTPGFLERYSDRLAPDDLATTQLLTEAFSTWVGAIAAWSERYGRCVVHGDYRLDNMLFGTPPRSASLTVVDWQTVSLGIGPADVAYFCGAGLLPGDRARHERALVARYAAGLRAAGVAISDDAVWDGYVLGSASGLFMAVLASQVVERTERGDEMFAVMAERHAAQIRDVDLAGALGITHQPTARASPSSGHARR
jgi:hypothetical protein